MMYIPWIIQVLQMNNSPLQIGDQIPRSLIVEATKWIILMVKFPLVGIKQED